MEVIDGVFVVPGHVHLGGNSTQLVDELEMKRLASGGRSVCQHMFKRREQEGPCGVH